MGKVWILGVLYAIYLIHEVYIWFPSADSLPSATTEQLINAGWIAPFPFSSQLVSVQYYIFMSCKYLIWVLFMLIIYALLPEERQVMKMFLAFQVLEFFEYHLTYNEPLSQLYILNYPVGINITTIKVVVMFVPVSTKIIASWNPGK